MNIICAILTGLQYVVQSIKALVKRTKISKKDRREKAVFVVGSLAVAAVAFTFQGVHAQGKNQVMALEREEAEEEEQAVYGLESIIQGVLLSQDTESQINKIGTSFELVLVGQRTEKKERFSHTLIFRCRMRRNWRKLKNQSAAYSESQLVMSDEDYKKSSEDCRS